MRTHDRTWSDWVVTLAGMILAGAVIGFLVALVMTICFKYLWFPSAPSRSLKNPRKKYSANERLPLSALVRILILNVRQLAWPIFFPVRKCGFQAAASGRDRQNPL